MRLAVWDRSAICWRRIVATFVGCEWRLGNCTAHRRTLYRAGAVLSCCVVWEFTVLNNDWHKQHSLLSGVGKVGFELLDEGWQLLARIQWNEVDVFDRRILMLETDPEAFL